VTDLFTDFVKVDPDVVRYTDERDRAHAQYEAFATANPRATPEARDAMWSPVVEANTKLYAAHQRAVVNAINIERAAQAVARGRA
jgi:hypothetical protein